MGDCQCAKCQMVDAEVRGQAEDELEKTLVNLTDYQFYEFLEDSESGWLQNQIKKAEELGLMDAKGYLIKEITWTCLRCGEKVVLRSQRHVRIPLCDTHKLEYDRWKDLRRHYGEKTVEQRRKSGVLFEITPRKPTKKVGRVLQEKKKRGRVATKKEVQTAGKPAVLKSENFQDERPHKQHV